MLQINTVDCSLIIYMIIIVITDVLTTPCCLLTKITHYTVYPAGMSKYILLLHTLCAHYIFPVRIAFIAMAEILDETVRISFS